MVKKNQRKESKPKTSGTGSTPIEKELELAYERIGDSSPIRRLSWLLDFAYADLSKKGQGELISIGWEVTMFGLNKPPKQVTADEVKQFLVEEDPAFESIPTVSWSVVRGFQDDMKMIFEGGRWWYVYPRNEKMIVFPYARNPEYEPFEWKDIDADQLLRLRAFELVDAEQDRLMICENPRCRRKFVSSKKGRSRFHTPTCSAYVRIAKARAKKQKRAQPWRRKRHVSTPAG